MYPCCPKSGSCLIRCNDKEAPSSDEPNSSFPSFASSRGACS